MALGVKPCVVHTSSEVVLTSPFSPNFANVTYLCDEINKNCCMFLSAQKEYVELMGRGECLHLVFHEPSKSMLTDYFA